MASASFAASLYFPHFASSNMRFLRFVYSTLSTLSLPLFQYSHTKLVYKINAFSSSGLHAFLANISIQAKHRGKNLASFSPVAVRNRITCSSTITFAEQCLLSMIWFSLLRDRQTGKIAKSHPDSFALK